MTESVSCRNRCDVHILLSESNSNYHNICFNSLSNEPINLHILPGIPGNIGLGRHKGFNTGSAEFVSFIDDDDYIIPGIFQKCYDVLDENPEVIGVVTKEQRLYNGKLLYPDEIDLTAHWVSLVKHLHHILVFRRDKVLPYVDLIKDCNTGEIVYMLIEILSDGHRFGLIDEVGYIWRVHDGSGHKALEMPSKHRERGQELLKKGAKEANELWNASHSVR